MVDASIINEIFSRCINLLDQNLIDNSDYYGWPQYLPHREGDIPGLCGTSYSLLTYFEVSLLIKNNLLSKFDHKRLLETLNSKMNMVGGFMVDTHRPIPTTDACWESIMDMLALGVPSNYQPLNLSVRYLCDTINNDDGWGISEASAESRVFPTTQVVSIFSILLDNLAVNKRLIPTIKAARDKGLSWLLSARNKDDGWGDYSARKLNGKSSAANTARAIVALLDAGVSVNDDIIVDGVARLKSFVEVGNTDDDYVEVHLYGDKYGVPASNPKLFRYSNFTEAWALYGLLRAGQSPEDDIILKLVDGIVSRENKGFWQDKFDRYDTEDGRVEWKAQEKYLDKISTKKQRIALWPIYNNVLALRSYLEVKGSNK